MLKRSLIISGVVVISVLLLALSPVSVRVEPINRTNATASEIDCSDPEIASDPNYKQVCEPNCIDEACSNHHAKPANQCPEGSYPIGEDENGIICKNEPTGCPYGDSIPLDSPKCSPPEENKKEGNNVGSNSEVRNSRSTESQKEQPVGSCISK